MAAPFRIRSPRPPVLWAGGASGTTGISDADSYLERLLKLIPGEGVGLYIAGRGVIRENSEQLFILWTLVCLGAVVLLRAIGSAGLPRVGPVQWPGVAIASVSFLVWTYSLGDVTSVYRAEIGSLMILAWTFFAPYLYRGTPQ